MNLFSRYKQKKHTLPPKPPWLKWLLLGFIAYAAAVVSLPKGDKPSQIAQIKEEIVSQDALGLSGYQQKIFPEYGAGLKIQDTVQGSGDPAICGQRVALTYQTFLAQGNVLPDQADAENPLRFTVGDGHVMPVFDRGVIGMKPGGTRSIIASPLMSYGLEPYQRKDIPYDAHVRVEMNLLAAEPALPNLENVPYRLAEIAVGNGAMVTCGQPVAVTLSVWDMHGKKYYATPENQPFILTPGSNQAMLGLEQGVLGMLEGGARLLVLPPEFHRTMHGKTVSQPFSPLEGQVMLIELTARHLVLDNAPPTH